MRRVSVSRRPVSVSSKSIMKSLSRRPLLLKSPRIRIKSDDIRSRAYCPLAASHKGSRRINVRSEKLRNYLIYLYFLSIRMHRLNILPRYAAKDSHVPVAIARAEGPSGDLLAQTSNIRRQISADKIATYSNCLENGPIREGWLKRRIISWWTDESDKI